MKNEDFLNITYPPQWIAKILHFCISGALLHNNRGLKTELIYCVIPILAIDDIRKNLNRATNKSTFFSMFEKNMSDKQEFSINFSERYKSFLKITNNGLIFLGNSEKIAFGEYIFTPQPRTYKKNKNSGDSEFERAAFYLGQLFAKEEPKNIFLKLDMVPS